MAQLGHLQTVQALYYYNIALVFSLFVLFVVLLVNFTEKKRLFSIFLLMNLWKKLCDH